jgi:hypothetical protein
MRPTRRRSESLAEEANEKGTMRDCSCDEEEKVEWRSQDHNDEIQDGEVGSILRLLRFLLRLVSPILLCDDGGEAGLW